MLDVQTLIVVAAFSGFVMAWSIAVLARETLLRAEGPFWLTAGLAVGVGFGLIAARAVLPPAVTIVVANGLIVLGQCAMLMGIQIHLGRRPDERLPLAVLLLTVAGFIWFGLVAPDTSARIILVSLAQTLLAVAVVQTLRRTGLRPGVGSLRVVLVAFPFGLHGAASLLRALVTLLFDADIDAFFSAGLIQAAAVLEMIVFMTLATVALSALVLNRESRRANDIIEATGVGTWDWSIAADEAYVNDRWAAMLGYRPAELGPISRDLWSNLLHPDDRDGVIDALRAHLDGRTPHFEAEARLRHKDGHWVWVLHRGRVVEWHADGRPARMTGTFTDVTERVIRAREVENQRNLMNNLAAQVPGVIYQFAARVDGTMCFPFASQGIQAIYGVSPEEVRTDATAVIDRLHPDDKARVIDEIQASARDLTPWRSEYRVVLPGGQVSWREGNAMPERLPDGGVLWHGFITNIEARVEKQRALEDYARELEFTRENLEKQAADLVALAEQQAETQDTLAREVATKNRFFSIIAHDLRSPFTVLLGMSELLAEPDALQSQEKRQVYAGHVHDSARQAFALVEQLLDWARIQMGSSRPEPQAVDVATIAEDVIADMGQAASAKGVMVKQVAPAGLKVRADPQMLKAVMRNFTSNAIKFTDRGGRVWIDAASSPDGSEVTISVHDTGVGLDPEQVAHLFDVAIKTTSPGTEGEPGTGLGLPLCAEMVRLNGGRIDAGPGPQGVGTTLRVTLPAALGSQDAVA